MLKQHKGKFIVSCLITLLPMVVGILLWNKLPDTMTTHWGADGNPDGTGGKALVVFGLPCILLGMHILCLVATLLDKRQKGQSPKALGMIFWIMPTISLLANGIMYYAAFGKEFNLAFFMSLLMGLLFLVMGNYLPKIKQNKTLGIKLSWTLLNEENWNKTHRFGGKVWVVCGIVVLVSAFLPPKAMVAVLVGAVLLAAVLPTVYSYCIYRKHKGEGIEYSVAPKTRGDKIGFTVSVIAVPVVLAVLGVLMFTGNVQVEHREGAMELRASYWEDLTVAYSEIDTLTYREELDVGMRTNGFGSARLALGIFQNEEFGTYTLYSYTGAKEFVVLTSGEDTLVIGLKTPEETERLYETLLSNVKE